MNFQQTSLGIEFGSTRIKAVLIDREHRVLATGSHTWENELRDGIWTYSLDSVISGLQACYTDLKRKIEDLYGQKVTTFGCIGISAMMHGYLPLDKKGEPLTAFRTWRNTITADASKQLTELFGFHIPQRWTIAHLYQAVLNDEEHVKDIASLMTLATYIHWRLSGVKAAGLGEASGIIPLDLSTLDYDQRMIRCFDALVADRQYPWKLEELLPRAVPAGQQAGTLTAAGARLLDPSGDLQPGIPMTPCEGDADTGMIATNCIRPRTGNVSAGTSAFVTLVADHPLGVHREVDMFCTPDGQLAAMVHSSNCTSDLNAWIQLFSQFARAIGSPVDDHTLYTLLFREALKGQKDGGGLISYNCFSGESVTGLNEGTPVFLRRNDVPLNLADFMRCHLMSALVTMKIGLDLLIREEHLKIDRLYAQGGFFKTPEAGQRLLSAAVNAPVSIMETAGEGGPYGMALLGAYMLWRKEGESLADYLDSRVFAGSKVTTLMADNDEVKGFADYAAMYLRSLPVEETAIQTLYSHSSD